MLRNQYLFKQQTYGFVFKHYNTTGYMEVSETGSREKDKTRIS